MVLGGSLRLKAVKYGVTGGQDLRLSVGLDLVHNEAGRLNRVGWGLGAPGPGVMVNART